MTTRFYTGVGSRSTPTNILSMMSDIAEALAIRGYVLRSGGASGADSYFEYGCDRVDGPKRIYYANHATPASMKIASEYHPAWDRCSTYVRKLHGRNSFQVLGDDLNTPSLVVICWTPDGCSTHADRSIQTGGTGTAISIADAWNITIHNLASPKTLAIYTDWLNNTRRK